MPSWLESAKSVSTVELIGVRSPRWGEEGLGRAPGGRIRPNILSRVVWIDHTKPPWRSQAELVVAQINALKCIVEATLPSRAIWKMG